MKTDCGPVMLLPSRACFKRKRRFKKIVLISDELPLCGQLPLSGYFQVPQGWQLSVCVGGGRGEGEGGSTVLCYCSQSFKDYTPYPLSSLQSCNGEANVHGEGKKKSNVTLSKKDKCSYYSFKIFPRI